MSQYVRVGYIKMRNVPSLMLSSSDTHDQTQKSKQFNMPCGKIIKMKQNKIQSIYSSVLLIITIYWIPIKIVWFPSRQRSTTALNVAAPVN